MNQIDQQRERVLDDLRGLIAGDVRCDDLFVQLYASDGGIHEIRPLCVVRPRSTADVVACVQYCAEKRLPLHPRGGGTGAAGGVLGVGVVLDFSRYLRRILRIEEATVRVQAGAVLERLNAQLRPDGRIFGPDPTRAAVTTLGSVIAVDAAGSHWLKYGSARDQVRSLQVVLADGQVMELSREPIVPQGQFSVRKQELIERVASLIEGNLELIRQQTPKCPIAHCGYNLSDVLRDGHVDFPRLLAGSEGTLAVITEATLATHPIARCRAASLLFFESQEKAARSVLDILPMAPTACELMDRRHLSLAREIDARFESLIPGETEAVLLVEQEGETPAEVRDWMHRLVDSVWHEKRSAFGARLAFDQEDAQLFWNLLLKVQPALYRVKGPSRPIPVIDDVAVAPAVLPDFLFRVQNVFKRRQVTASMFCHAGQGQLHVYPFLDLDSADDVERLRGLAEEYYQEAFDAGGTIGGEQACGLSRTSFIRRQAGPLYDVFWELKRLFDPQGILNPDKIVSDAADLMSRDLRPGLKPPADLPAAEGAAQDDDAGLRDLVELQLNWAPSRVADTVETCNRCGECRTQSPEARMCPMLRFAPSEEASPRSKVNLLRGILSGRLDLKELTGDDFKSIADLCTHCHSCRIECPARVDVPRLMSESKGAYVTVNGLRFPEWVAAHLNLFGELGSRLSPAANWALGNRTTRWLMEKALGIAQGRKLPRVSSRPFLRRAAKRRLTRAVRRDGRRVAYFTDVYANYFDPQLGEALVNILRRNGVAVFVPPEQHPSGMPSVAMGALEHARYVARKNVAMLAEAVRQGYHVLATEPAAALCLKQIYPQLIDDDDSRLVAQHSSEACTYLWNLHTTGELQLDLKTFNATVGYHMPCHLRALEVGAPGESLLRLIPGLRLQRVEEGCCGMAGTFGLLHKNYRSSLRAGWSLISRLRDPRIQAYCTECSACKIQMEHGTTKPTLHPIKLLAMAYGLLPLVEGVFPPGEELSRR